MRKKVIIAIIAVIILIAAISGYFLMQPQYKEIEMSGFTLEVPNSEAQVINDSKNYNTYTDEKNNLTIKTFTPLNINDFNSSIKAGEEMGKQLLEHPGQTVKVNGTELINDSGVYTYFSNDSNGYSLLLISSTDIDTILHIINTKKAPQLTVIGNNTLNVSLNDTNDTNDTNVQNTKKKSTKSSSSSSDIPSEGTYKGVSYSLHKGGYPYYSPQAGKTYYSKSEEYRDMKAAIDSGIAS